MKDSLFTREIQSEPDIVVARQSARLLAQHLGFEPQDQTLIATAVFEVARSAFQHAGGGRVQCSVDNTNGPWFYVLVSDRGPGIPPLPDFVDGGSGASTGRALGLVGAKRLMDAFRVESTGGRGTTVALGKPIPSSAPPLTADSLARIADCLAALGPQSLQAEVNEQNQELLRALAELRTKGDELTKLNRELAETNAGVVALYSELDEKAESIRRSSETKARFFAHMNHEVRTPINSILSLSEILLNGTLVAPLAEQEKPLGLIRKAAQHLSELVNDLLDLAKVESGTMVVRPENFLVSELFGALRGMFRPLHTNAAVALEFEDASTLAPLCTDEGKINQILRNFVSNALKFTERGEVRVSAVQEGDLVTFAVRDTGIGISSEDQKLLFREFSQVENRKQKFIRGTGLGLALSRHLAELLGGRVSVQSAVGQGATFRLSVPRVFLPRRAADRALAERGASQGDVASRPNVLIVDDDEGARYVLRHAIGDLPCSIVEAPSGSEGLVMAREQQPVVIFLDLTMPGMSGFEVLRLLKADEATKAIPVVVNTAGRLTAEERRHLQEFALAILDKGASLAESTATVRDALARAGLVSLGADQSGSGT